jgi:hypothetical protein
VPVLQQRQAGACGLHASGPYKRRKSSTTRSRCGSSSWSPTD